MNNKEGIDQIKQMAAGSPDNLNIRNRNFTIDLNEFADKSKPFELELR